MLALPIVACFALVAAVCGSGQRQSSGPGDSIAGQARVGFLPTATATPKPPGARDGYFGTCPPFPGATCAVPGEHANLYIDLALDRGVSLEGSYCKQPHRYIFDRAQLTELLSTINRDTQSRMYTPPDFSTQDQCLSDRTHFRFTLVFPDGAGPPRFSSGYPHLDGEADLEADTLSIGNSQVAWGVPAEFSLLLKRYLTSAGPSPTPSARRVAPATIAPPAGLSFSAQDDPLIWDGSDDHVSSLARGHCENGDLVREFGIPASIIVDHKLGFWSARIVPRDPAWHWTGYYHGEWQIWQGHDPETAFLVYAPETRVAFEYKSAPCA